MTSKKELIEAFKTIERTLEYDCDKELTILYDFIKQQTHQPTLSDCIKEWNKKGFDVDVYAVEIVIANYSTVKCEADEVEFSIDLLSKQVNMPNGCYAKLDFKIYHLLSKTLKALEVEDEKEN